MTTYKILSQNGHLRLAYLGSSAKLAFQPHGVNFPVILYSRKVANDIATEYGGKVKEVG